MGTRHISLLEQKKMQWAKEREELARLSAPWGNAENVKPLRKRVEPNLQEEPEGDPQYRTYANSTSPSVKDSPIEDNSINVTYVSVDDRGRPIHRGSHESDSRSPSLPPVNLNVVEDSRRRVYYRGKEMIAVRPEMYEGYLYINDNQNISKSAENFCSSASDHHAKRKAYLSGDHLGDSSSVEKFPAEISPYSSSYHLRNSNLSIATEGDSTWREWSSSRGVGDEPRPRWGDRGINVGPPWNSGGSHAITRNGDSLAPPENYPTPGWVERGLSRMSNDGRGRGGSAEYQRCDPGIRVVVSDDTGGVQRIRGSMTELQNAGYGPGGGMHQMTSQRNFDRHPASVSYTGEMPGIHSSIGTPQRTEGNQGESVISLGHDDYNVNEISRNGRQYGCISAPNKPNAGYNFKKNDEVTSSLPNLQCANSHLRGQNVPVDPEVIVERELRRLKAMELQKAIRQQLEEREKKRILEKEQRLKEEKALEERSRKLQEEERLRKEEEERKHREKEELERKKEGLMREALEVAEQEAQKQRKKRSLHRHEVIANEEDINKTHSEVNILMPDDHMSNYTTSPCPAATEGSPAIISQPVQSTSDHVDYGLSPSYVPDVDLTSRSRSPSVYEGAMAYHPSAAQPIAPFKITLPDPTAGVSHDGRELSDQKRGGVLIVGRDVYLLPYVNTEVLAPKLMNGSTYSFGPFGGFENLGNGLFNDHNDYRREWIGSSAQIKSTKDVSTQTDPCSQGPLLLLLRMAEPEGEKNGSELRSSTGDSSMPECDCKESTERSCSTDSGEYYSDCHFCHRMHTQSQPTSSKESGADVTTKRQQQADQRPKWGANRPSCKYTTQSEKAPHFSNRNGSQKRSVQGRNKRDTSEVTEEVSESYDHSSKPNSKTRSKNEHVSGSSSMPSGSRTTRSPTPRNKRHAGKKSSEKAVESKKSDHQKEAQISQPPLPALAPPKKETPRRVQIVKPSLSLDQDSNGYSEHLYPDPSGSRTQHTYLPTTQLSPSALQSEMKHLFPPVLPVIQQGCLSPIRINQSPMPPARINSSPLPSSRLSSTSMPPLSASQSPIPSSRQTPIPTSPSPPLQKPPKSNRQCSSPPVPAVLAKIRREQKSPPRQSSFITSVPDREERVVTSRRESRSGTPSVKPPTPGPSSSNPRPKSESAILLVSPREPGSAVLIKPLSPIDLESKNSTLLNPAQNEVPVSPVVNISYPSSSSPGEDALMLVTLSEDISIGSPSPNPLSSVLEIDDKSSYLLVTPSDEISLGFDCRSNFSVSRASQVSADLMPEGFWGDFGSSANMLTPYPEANSARSTMEEHSSISKAEDIDPDNNLPDNVVKTDGKSSNNDKSEGVDSEKEIQIVTLARNEESKERESKGDTVGSKKLEGDEKEVKSVLQESQDKMKDKQTISHAEIHEDKENLDSKSKEAIKPKGKNFVNVESDEQKPEDSLKTDAASLADPPTVSDVDEADNQADVEEVNHKVDSDVKETNTRDSSIHFTDKDEQSEVKELKEMKEEESSTSVKGNKELSEVDPEARHEAKNKLEVQELPAEERKDNASEKEVLDEKNEKEKK